MPNNFEIIKYTGKSNGLDMKMFYYNLCTKFASKPDLDLHASNVSPASHTFSCLDNYLYQIILKSHHARLSYKDRTQTCFTEAFAQSLSPDCDLDF